jgi:hypothetical protein
LGLQLVPAREKSRLHRDKADILVTQTLRNNPCNVCLANAAGKRHRQLHGNTGAVQFTDQAAPQALRAGSAQGSVADFIAAIELKKYEDSIPESRQSSANLRPVEDQTIRGEIDFSNALLTAKPLEDLPELRMQAGFSAGDLDGVEPAFLGQKLSDMLLEIGQWQDPIAIGIRIAHATREIAGIGDLHQHGACLVRTLIGKISVGKCTCTRATLTRSATRSSERRYIHPGRLRIRAAPAIFAGDTIVVRIIFKNRFARSMCFTLFADPDPAIPSYDGGWNVTQAFRAQADRRL